MTEENTTNQLLDAIIEGIEEVKGEEITILDLREIENSVCQYFVVCHGNSNTQVAAIASSIERTVRKETKDRPLHVEGTQNAQWILLDYVSVVVHVFQERVRERYSIESMWGDAKVVQPS